MSARQRVLNIPELLIHIFSACDVPSNAACCLVCKDWEGPAFIALMRNRWPTHILNRIYRIDHNNAVAFHVSLIHTGRLTWL